MLKPHSFFFVPLPLLGNELEASGLSQCSPRRTWNRPEAQGVRSVVYSARRLELVTDLSQLPGFLATVPGSIASLSRS